MPFSGAHLHSEVKYCGCDRAFRGRICAIEMYITGGAQKGLTILLRASSRHETRRGGHAEFRIIIIIIYLLMVYKLYTVVI